MSAADRGPVPPPPAARGAHSVGEPVVDADRPRSGTSAGTSLNGLTPHVRQVEAARERLGQDLERLNYEVRAQMGVTVEKLAWKAAVVGTSILAVLGTQKVLTAGWRSARHSDPPTNPANPQTQWGEAVAWTLATAVAAAFAKIVAARAAAAGWEKATGSLPPGLEE